MNLKWALHRVLRSFRHPTKFRHKRVFSVVGVH
ncbi:Uncharacterised protein [Vibrio cholerae]|nr:Uncharacterised protein [Vibrio cholerae]